jgi:hypothetical protein
LPLANQDEKRRLEGVVSIVLIAHDAAAGAQHHGAVAFHEGLEGNSRCATLIRGEPFQKLAIGQSCRRSNVEKRAQVSPDRHILVGCHGFALSAFASVLKMIKHRRGGFFPRKILDCRK